MKVVVVTGSTRGIGYGMADEFLKRGCTVVINGRSQENVDKAVTELSKTHDAARILGIPCGVSDYAGVQAMWDESVARFGRVDFWINNAGINIPIDPYVELPIKQITRIVDVNLLGVMYPSHVALRGMLAQGFGQLFNMEGFGSAGQMRPGFTSYGTTKYALRYFTKSLQKEIGDSPVLVGTLSPGMVITDLLIADYEGRPEEFARAKKIFNILADTVETVTPYLVERTLKNTRQGASIAWLTNAKIALRFLSAPFNRRDLFVDRSAS